MTISILAQAVVDKNSGGDPAYTHAGFAVPGGTTRLLVQVEYRGYSSGAAPAISSVTHNGDAMSLLTGSATTGGFDDITTAWYHLASPDIGTFNIVVTLPSDIRGCKMWMLAISGEKESGSILGQSAFQRTAATATNTVGLGLTPAASGDSLLLASLSIAQATTLSSFTGTGFVEVDTGSYTGGGNLTSTSRYKLNASGSTTASATFGASDTDIGGSLIEILAEPTGTDVSDTFGVTVAVTGSVASRSSASIADASYRRLLSWTEVLSIQPDAAGVDRRIIAAGPETAPNLALDQSGTAYRATWRTTDGVVIVETAAGSQSVAAQHLAVVADVAGDPAIYLNGFLSGGVIQGGDLVGITDIGTGGQTIGSHTTSTPGAYTGLVGRYLLYASAMSPEQIRLLALSETDPDVLWGYGVEDDAEETNQSLVACPLEAVLDGQPSATLTPTILDPAGGTISIASVTQPINGTLAIAGSNRLVYVPTPGWQGSDTATYTASDGSKLSTGKISIRQQQPSLKANGDSVTVAENGSVTFNPRVNDVGAGSLFVVGATQGSLGSATVNADGTITYQNTSAGSSDSFTYTVADNYGQATASVSVTITATSFVSASADSMSTLQGTAVDIDVIANDTASSDNLPLVVLPGSITTPSPSGTATLQADGRIRYTPVSGFTGAASFNYTAKPASKTTPTSTAVCSVQVLAAPVGFPKVPTGPFTATLRVPSAAYPTINAALAAAAPGNRILVANGTYREAIDSAKSGSAAGGYIYIVAENHLGATLAGTAAGDPLSWKFTGSYIWVTGFVCNNPSKSSPDAVVGNKNYYYNSNREEYQFRLFGHHMRVTNCLINAPSGIGISANSAVHDIDVCYNTFTMRQAPRWNQNNSIYVGSFSYTVPLPDRIVIARNKWFNDLEFDSSAASSPGEGRYCIYMGNNEPQDNNVGVNRTCKIWENYVNMNFVSRGYYLKRTPDVRRNYIAINRGGGNFNCFNLRHGGYSQSDGTVFTTPPLSDSNRGWIEGNNFANGKTYINDTDHLWLGNRFVKNVELRYGGRRWKKNSTNTGWIPSDAEGWVQAASRNIFIGCQFGGTLILGTGEDAPPRTYYRLDAGQGGVIRGVECHRGIQTAPTVTRLKDWDNNASSTPPKPAGAGIDAVAAGNAGYQLFDGTDGKTVPPWITDSALLTTGVGCDPAP